MGESFLSTYLLKQEKEQGATGTEQGQQLLGSQRLHSRRFLESHVGLALAVKGPPSGGFSKTEKLSPRDEWKSITLF